VFMRVYCKCILLSRFSSLEEAVLRNAKCNADLHDQTTFSFIVDLHKMHH